MSGRTIKTRGGNYRRSLPSALRSLKIDGEAESGRAFDAVVRAAADAVVAGLARNPASGAAHVFACPSDAKEHAEGGWVADCRLSEADAKGIISKALSDRGGASVRKKCRVCTGHMDALTATGHVVTMRGRQGDAHSILIDQATGVAYGANDRRSADSKAAIPKT